MSLTLDDAQAKALKKWWRWAMERRGLLKDEGKLPHVELADALRPLFEPWRVNDTTPWVVEGRCGQFVRCHHRNGDGDKPMAVRIRDLLNAAERGEPS